MEKDAQSLKVPLERAISIFGSQSALAEAAGCTQQSISYALKPGHKLSGEMAVAIEIATNRQITRGELRPDLFVEAAE